MLILNKGECLYGILQGTTVEVHRPLECGSTLHRNEIMKHYKQVGKRLAAGEWDVLKSLLKSLGQIPSTRPHWEPAYPVTADRRW